MRDKDLPKFGQTRRDAGRVRESKSVKETKGKQVEFGKVIDYFNLSAVTKFGFQIFNGFERLFPGYLEAKTLLDKDELILQEKIRYQLRCGYRYMHMCMHSLCINTYAHIV